MLKRLNPKEIDYMAILDSKLEKLWQTTTPVTQSLLPVSIKSDYFRSDDRWQPRQLFKFLSEQDLYPYSVEKVRDDKFIAFLAKTDGYKAPLLIGERATAVLGGQPLPPAFINNVQM